MAMIDLAPASPHKNRLTYWSRHDPVVMPRSNTDHWTIMKQRAEKMSAADPRMTQSARGIPPGVVDLRDLMKRAKSKTQLSFPGPNGDGRVDPKGDPVFASVAKRDLHGAVPGNYTFLRPTTTPRKSLNSNIYSQRAREGYKHWYQERPRPTSFGRYGLGSYKTVLGIGNAPRT